MTMRRMTIGELAKLAGVGVETVRYYQRRGVLPEPARQLGRTREYSPETLELLRFIRRARRLGFTMREVERLVVLRRTRRDASEPARMLAKKAAELEQRVREMQGIVAELKDLVVRCESAPATERWEMFDSVSDTFDEATTSEPWALLESASE